MYFKSLLVLMNSLTIPTVSSSTKHIPVFEDVQTEVITVNESSVHETEPRSLSEPIVVTSSMGSDVVKTVALDLIDNYTQTSLTIANAATETDPEKEEEDGEEQAAAAIPLETEISDPLPSSRALQLEELNGKMEEASVKIQDLQNTLAVQRQLFIDQERNLSELLEKHILLLRSHVKTAVEEGRLNSSDEELLSTDINVEVNISLGIVIFFVVTLL